MAFTVCCDDWDISSDDRSWPLGVSWDSTIHAAHIFIDDGLMVVYVPVVMIELIDTLKNYVKESR